MASRKKIEHRGEHLQVNLNETASVTLTECPDCHKQLKNTNGLGSHKVYCKARSDRIAQENLDNTAEPSTSDTQPALNVKPATKLVEYSLSSDEEDAQPREQNPPDAPPAKKPKKSRKAYSAKFKLRVLEEVMDKGPTDYDIDIAEKYGIEKSLIPKWMKKYDDLENAVASEVSADCKKTKTQR